MGQLQQLDVNGEGGATPSGVLGTDKFGNSCLMVSIVAESYSRTVDLRIPLFLRAAEKHGLLWDLLAMTDNTGENIFHWAKTEAELRILVEALDRLGLCADCPLCVGNRTAVVEG